MTCMWMSFRNRKTVTGIVRLNLLLVILVHFGQLFLGLMGHFERLSLLLVKLVQLCLELMGHFESHIGLGQFGYVLGHVRSYLMVAEMADWLVEFPCYVCSWKKNQLEVTL